MHVYNILLFLIKEHIYVIFSMFNTAPYQYLRYIVYN